MWLGQAKFYCTECGRVISADIRQLIEQRCKDLAIDPEELGEKASEAARFEMLRELGDEPDNPRELAFIKATALMLLELAYSPTLFCSQCRLTKSGREAEEKVKLRLLKGGKSDS